MWPVFAEDETIHIPRGAWHSTRNAGRRIVIFSPAGAETLFTKIGRATPDAHFDMVDSARAATDHGLDFA